MAKYLIAVETNCADASREAEFNEWYDKTHLPDVLETPGFIRATRYENTEPSKERAKFLALYEVETNDIEKFNKANADNMAKKRAAGRFSDLLVIGGRGLYKQLSSVSRGKK